MTCEEKVVGLLQCSGDVENETRRCDGTAAMALMWPPPVSCPSAATYMTPEYVAAHHGENEMNPYPHNRGTYPSPIPAPFYSGFLPYAPWYKLLVGKI